MPTQLLLLEDVDCLGRSGDVVSAKPGFARNFLIPQKKAVVADKFTLRMQARLKEERAKQAELDRKDSEILAAKIEPMVLELVVKVDPDGHMYGSVSAIDIVKAFEKEGISLEKKSILLSAPIKEIGTHKLQLRLKEGVPASCMLQINSDKPLPAHRQPKSEEKSVVTEEEQNV